MRTKIMLAAVAAAAAAVPLAASAYEHGKPGLWEYTSRMTFTKGGPQIPPDKLEMMKQMGIQIPGMGQPVVTQACVTPEQAAMDKPPVSDPRHQCQTQNFKHEGKGYSADLVCSGEFTGTGHTSVTYDSDEHFSGSMSMSGTNQHTGAVEMQNEISGQFKSADCGSVKPLGKPAQ